MEFSGKNPSQIGLSGIMGGFDNEVYHHIIVFYSCEWKTKGRDYTLKRSKTKGSFYLFFFCVEGLNALLWNVVARGEIQGFSICRNGPKLTHLFFADDCLILCRSTLEECNKIQELLACYEVDFGSYDK